ncbi:hypothetical protein SC171_21855 [Pantoea cypripedii]|uniref:hypothetical protein n=1 Tax=Pantoea cypripedii TaxID=55209 RepID=UPI002FC7F3D4
METNLNAAGTSALSISAENPQMHSMRLMSLNEVKNTLTAMLSAGRYQRREKIDFGSFVEGLQQRSREIFRTATLRKPWLQPVWLTSYQSLSAKEKDQLIPDLYRKYGNYGHTTTEGYRAAKRYPSGIDCRPVEFDPMGNDNVAHATTFEAVIRAIIHCNLQIVPLLKQFKLDGIPPEYIAMTNRGATHFDCTHVRAVKLNTFTSNFYELDYLAKDMVALLAQGDDNLFKTVSVIIIGNGIGDEYVHSEIDNDTGLKRIDIRVIAFETDGDKQKGIECLRIIGEKLKIPAVADLRVCTFPELHACQRDYGLLNDRTARPDIASLYEKSERVGP